MLEGTQTWCGALAEEVVAHPESRENWMNCMLLTWQNRRCAWIQCSKRLIVQASRESPACTSSTRRTAKWAQPQPLARFRRVLIPLDLSIMRTSLYIHVLIRSWSWTFTPCNFWTDSYGLHDWVKSVAWYRYMHIHSAWVGALRLSARNCQDGTLAAPQDQHPSPAIARLKMLGWTGWIGWAVRFWNRIRVSFGSDGFLFGRHCKSLSPCSQMDLIQQRV